MHDKRNGFQEISPPNARSRCGILVGGFDGSEQMGVPCDEFVWIGNGAPNSSSVRIDHSGHHDRYQSDVPHSLSLTCRRCRAWSVCARCSHRRTGGDPGWLLASSSRRAPGGAAQKTGREEYSSSPRKFFKMVPVCFLLPEHPPIGPLRPSAVGSSWLAVGWLSPR